MHSENLIDLQKNYTESAEISKDRANVALRHHSWCLSCCIFIQFSVISLTSCKNGLIRNSDERPVLNK